MKDRCAPFRALDVPTGTATRRLSFACYMEMRTYLRTGSHDRVGSSDKCSQLETEQKCKESTTSNHHQAGRVQIQCAKVVLLARMLRKARWSGGRSVSRHAGRRHEPGMG